MGTIRRILVPTDFGSTSTAAWAFATDLARTLGAELYVLHVVDDLVATVSELPGDGPLRQLQRDLEQSAWDRLGTLSAAKECRDLDVRSAVVASAAAAVAIVDYARDARIDLLVMGTHGRGALSRLMLGSTADHVIRTAPCPVLTIRSEHTGSDSGAVSLACGAVA
jgi:nucleotide-binding universal stress UspA family protein